MNYTQVLFMQDNTVAYFGLGISIIAIVGIVLVIRKFIENQ